MKDRMLLLVTGVAAAGLSALMFRASGEYTPALFAFFGIVGVIGFLTKRKK